MTKLAKYMKSSAVYLVLIVGLLFLQAYCDLELPDYTSRIVNEGIQQKGIEDGVPDKMREETAENLLLFLDEEQSQMLNDSYTLEDGIYTLKELSEEERQNLNSTLATAELMVMGFSQESEQTEAMRTQMQLPEGVSILDAMKQMPEEMRAQVLSAVMEQMEAMPEMMTDQSAILFVQQEYEAMGENLDDRQTSYILKTGGSMLLLALLAMAASIGVRRSKAKWNLIMYPLLIRMQMKRFWRTYPSR